MLRKNFPEDTTAIQTLISLANPGDTVKLTKEEYSECFSIEKPITIIGNGIDQTVITGDTLKPAIQILSDNVVIKNITIRALTKTHYDENHDCNKHSPTNGIEISNSANVILDSIKVLGGEDKSSNWNISGGDGLVITGSQNVSIANSEIIGANANNFDTYSCNEENGGSGLEVTGCESINIIRSTIKGGKGGNGYSMGASPHKGGYGGNSLKLNNSSNIQISNSHLIGRIGGKTASTGVEFKEQAKAGDGAYCSNTEANFFNSILEGGEALINTSPSNLALNTLGGNGITLVNNSKIHIDGGELIAGASSEDAMGMQFYFDSTSTIKFSNIDVDTSMLVKDYKLEQNYPNPFNSTTTIEYSVPQKSNVTIKVYDVLGREVQTLVSEEKERGNYKIQLNASYLSSGIYFYKFSTNDYQSVKKLVLLK